MKSIIEAVIEAHKPIIDNGMATIVAENEKGESCVYVMPMSSAIANLEGLLVHLFYWKRVVKYAVALDGLATKIGLVSGKTEYFRRKTVMTTYSDDDGNEEHLYVVKEAESGIELEEDVELDQPGVPPQLPFSNLMEAVRLFEETPERIEKCKSAFGSRDEMKVNLIETCFQPLVNDEPIHGRLN